MSTNFLIRVFLVEWILGVMGKKILRRENFLESVWVWGRGRKWWWSLSIFFQGASFIFLGRCPFFSPLFLLILWGCGVVLCFFYLTRHDFVFWTWFCQTFANFAKKSSKIVFKTRSPKNSLIVKARIWSH